MLALYLALISNEEDKRLFEEIYETYRNQMLSLAFSILKKEEDAEDAVHNVFYHIAAKHIEVLRRIENYEDRRNYLLKSVKNTALNMIRQSKQEAVSLDTVADFEPDNSKDLSDRRFIDMICNKMDYENLLTGIRELNKSYRDVLYYHFVLGLSAPETAKALNRSLPAVKKQLVRGKKQLLQNLGLKAGESENGNKQEGVSGRV